MPYNQPQQAPKVQSINMAPRQAAIQRAVTKTAKPKAMALGQSELKEYDAANPKPRAHALNPTQVKDFNKNGTLPNNGTVPIAAAGGPLAPAPTGQPTGQPVENPNNPDIAKYLAGDDVYQSILASLDKNKSMNQATYDYNKQNYVADNDTIKKRLAEQEGKDNKLLDNDYAARGLFGSGLFAKADSDLGQSYSDQNLDLATAFERNLQQLLTDQTSQTALDEETRRQAELDAITRRAQEFGIFGGPSNLTSQPKKGDDKKGKKHHKKGKK